jgi:hypothetical protein
MSFLHRRHTGSASSGFASISISKARPDACSRRRTPHLPGHPNHPPMMAELERIFHAHAKQGMVDFEYNTRVYYGRLS